ncbi:hypothetical protein [Paraburkholderia kururiensis]|uniref:Uncharacterized protein n=1 Tax=Paraburkholderia kururiensis TaxID=984307 RepID=A0ABZ0WJE6_9BURK|nr:hypothetical protein [Paraburkholderia kururiensis]WQD77451.1 hypothetical protein U0042_25945 [Paraburkholderia kururiensis]
MLALKLALVPAFLVSLALAARVWGPAVAGWLAGLPVVAGPIVLLLVLERGAAFGVRACAASIAAIAASEAFNFAYAATCRRPRWEARWPLALSAGLAAWLMVAALLVHLPDGVGWAFGAAGVAVAISQTWLPRAHGPVPAARVTRADLVLRMAMGAALTLAVTQLSASLGAAWSGVLSVFPLLGIVLAVSAQRAHGADFVARLMRGMVVGRASFAAFFAVAAALLPHAGTPAAFGGAALASVLVQGMTKRWLRGAGRVVQTTPDLHCSSLP